MTNKSNLQKADTGRSCSKDQLKSLITRTEKILTDMNISEHVAILTFGSAGNHFFVRNSDTDFTLLDDGTLSEDILVEFQARIFNEFDNNPWCVSFKSWKRIKVNPMDLLSLYFVCGNRKIFEKQVISNPGILNLVNENNLVTTLAGNDLHMKFMASHYFSRLLSLYHSTKELPVQVSYGDVKYYIGGTRAVQDLYMISMIYSKKSFLADTDPSVLAEKGIITEADLNNLNLALDFLLTVKNLCIEGNNIFYKRNIERITIALEASVQEVTAEYDHYIKVVKKLCYKAHRALVKDYPLHEGVVARTTSDSNTLSTLIDKNNLQLWRTIALRSDIPTDIKQKLADKIAERQKTNPHTMLDEMWPMLQFAAGETPTEAQLESWKTENETNLWLTDQVIDCFNNVLKGNMNQPDLIRLAVHSSFFELYRSGKYQDVQIFFQAYCDRVEKFFHCHTLNPDEAVMVAERACLRIIKCGLFHQEHLTLLELHLTNRCNLECSWCTYKSRSENQSIQFKDLKRIIDFAPKEILIAGGGEPTLYHDGEYNFNDCIMFLRTYLPGARLRIITNGTFIPNGDWLTKVDEISVSLDEECLESYLRNKGRDLYDIVWNNIQTYLYDSPISNIRVTKIYDNQNLFQSIILAKKLFSLWNELPINSIKRDYFKFMLFPMADDHIQESPYAESQLSTAQKKNWQEQLSNIKNEQPDFYCFIERNTNFADILKSDPAALPADRCWPVAHYMLVGADRKIYPCFAACSAFNSTAIGNIESQLDELTKARANLFSYPPQHCRKGCRPASVFYGLQSKRYYNEQIQLNLPVIPNHTENPHQIIHVSYQDPDHLLGGQGWAVYNLCKAQVKKGATVYWLSPCIKNEEPGEYLYENGLLRVIKIKFTDKVIDTLFADDGEVHKLRVKFGDIAVSVINRCFKPENSVIHLHGFIETPSRSLELRKAGYHVISTFHMLLSTRNKKLRNEKEIISELRESERLAVKNNSIITAPSMGMAEELKEIYPDYKGEIYCVENGIGNEHFDTPLDQIEEPQNRIVSYGRISPEKGFDLFIEAAKLITKSQKVMGQQLSRFTIFGNTDFSIKARREFAEALVQNAEKYSNIEVLASSAGIIGLEKINLIDRSIFGVIPSLYEPFGMVIPELMARGKPVISTLTLGTRDIMQTDKFGVNDFGYIVEPNAQAIAEAIEWMLTHPSEVKKMGQNAFERAKDYRWDRVADIFSDLYQRS